MTKQLLTLSDLTADSSLSPEGALAKTSTALKNVEGFAKSLERAAKSWRRSEKMFAKDGLDVFAGEHGELARHVEHIANEIRTAISKGISKK